MKRDPQWRWKVATLVAVGGLLTFVVAGFIGILLQAEREQDARLERQAAIFSGPTRDER